MFTGELWYEYLDEPMKNLVDQAYFLADQEELHGENQFDYAFVVFPMAKAYEGFLKKYLYDLGLITLSEYHGNHFRIGRSLNPDLPEKFRDEHWIYDDLEVKFAEKDKSLASFLWSAWRMGRNALFHYFPTNQEIINLEEANNRLQMLKDAMSRAVANK